MVRRSILTLSQRSLAKSCINHASFTLSRRLPRLSSKRLPRSADNSSRGKQNVRGAVLPARKQNESRITRGLDQLRTLRAIMDEVYRLFDRRCRMDTALEKLTQLRRRIKRFSTLKETLKKLSSPNLEKALTFLSWMTRCCLQRQTPWSVQTGDIVRCRKAYTGCEPEIIYVSG